MAYAKPVSNADFETSVLKSDQPVLVDFWASWCAPCRMVAPIVEDLARTYEGKLEVAKLDVDANNETAIQYQVQSIPTLILFKDGKPAHRIVGYMNRERLLAQLKPHLAFVS